MNKEDFVWLLILIGIGAFLVHPGTHAIFVYGTSNMPYIVGFIKFSVLATMGELLAIRMVSKKWVIADGVILRAVAWGWLGALVVLMFEIFAAGIAAAMQKQLLPNLTSALDFAFFVGLIMNVTFGPTMMALHRVSDTCIDMHVKGEKISVQSVVTKIDWLSFADFVILKTIPFFWVPAHFATS